MQRFQLMRLRMILEQVETAIAEEDAKPPPAEEPAPAAAADETAQAPKSDVRVVVGTTAMSEDNPGLVAAATLVINRACARQPVQSYVCVRVRLDVSIECEQR